MKPSPNRAVRRARGLTWAAVLALAGLVPWLALEIAELDRVRGINAALERGSVDMLATQETAHGLVARAYRAQEADRVDEALDLYSRAAAAADDPRLRTLLNFNVANLYLAKAVTYETGEQKPLMISLIEQAKHNYREILARDPSAWAARYNLSRALEMLPDLPDVQYGDEMNPERAPQAPKSDIVHERLP